MMISSRYYPLKSLTIKTCRILEDRHRRWREGKRQQRAHLDLAVELIRSYCSHMKNSNCIIGISTVRGVVTVAARSLSMERAS